VAETLTNEARRDITAQLKDENKDSKQKQTPQQEQASYERVLKRVKPILPNSIEKLSNLFIFQQMYTIHNKDGITWELQITSDNVNGQPVAAAAATVEESAPETNDEEGVEAADTSLYHGVISAALHNFTTRFEDVFHLGSKGYSPEQQHFARAALRYTITFGSLLTNVQIPICAYLCGCTVI
jgi:hypothetical protein